MSRICAEYVDGDVALAAARKLVDEGIPPEDIEIRSPYPLPELAIPPHRSTPSLMTLVVRLMGVVGILGAFGFIAYTQVWWDLKTDWHPVVSIPIDAINVFDCAMTVAIFATTFMFFWETRPYRRLTPPVEEDLPVAHGSVVVLVEGESTARAEGLLKDSGYKTLVPFATMLALLGVLTTGCGKYRTLDFNKHNMRDQVVIKPTEASEDPVPVGNLPMPDRLQQEVLPYGPLGWVSQSDLTDPKFKFSQPTPEERALANPVPATPESLGNGKRLYGANCAFCHGQGGAGDGPVGEVFSPKPANLATDPALAKKSDGDYYHWILVGKSTMPPFGARLATVEIFDILNYLRYLQKGGDAAKVEPAVRLATFTGTKPDLVLRLGSEGAPRPAVHAAPTPEPAASPTPEPSPSATPTPAAAAPSPAAATATAAELAAAGIPEAAASFPGAAEAAKAKLEIPDSLAAQGKEIYAGAGACASCHGDEGHGDGPAGSALQPPPRNLTAKADYRFGTSDQALYRTLVWGVPGTGMAAQGEAGGGALTDDQVKALVAYMKSLMK